MVVFRQSCQQRFRLYLQRWILTNFDRMLRSQYNVCRKKQRIQANYQLHHRRIIINSFISVIILSFSSMYIMQNLFLFNTQLNHKLFVFCLIKFTKIIYIYIHMALLTGQIIIYVYI